MCLYSFKKVDTNIAKGAAILFLLVHHLFYNHAGSSYKDIEIFSWAQGGDLQFVLHTCYNRQDYCLNVFDFKRIRAI